jgi:serine phosphatase RsbU (regulator of sigma subunit)
MARPAGTAGAPDGARALLGELPALACALDGSGNVVFANAHWRAHFPEAAGDLTAALAALAESGPEPLRERRVRLRDRAGRAGWYELRAQPSGGSEPGSHFLCVATVVDEAQRYDLYLEILADAGDAFATLPDVEDALRAIAGLLVPDVVEWFVFYRPPAGPAPDGAARAFTPRFVRHANAARAAEAAAALDSGGASAAAVARVARAGRAESIRGPELELDWIEAVVVPVAGRTELWGVLQFANGPQAAAALGAAELRLAREVARRAGAAFDNAALLESSERAADDMRFLASVGETMIESLELEERLDRFVHAVVPRLADWATVNLLADDGSLETVAIAHADPSLREAVERLRGRYNGNEDADGGTPMALRTGRPQLLTGINEELMHSHIRPESFDDVRALGADSAYIVPLAAHGRIYGTLSAMRGRCQRPFRESEMWLIEELARRAAVGIAHAKAFRQSADVAEAFQQASLPDALPAVAGFRFSAYYAPGRREATVGGDWYDAFGLTDGRLVISIGDVSGSGLAAAVIMGSVRQVIRGAAQLDADPRVILDATDRALRSEYPDIVVTAFVAVIGADRAQLTYASAGHPPPLLRTPRGKILELATVGLPLGLRERWDAPEASVALPPGSLLLFYTDGLIESTRNLLAGQRTLQRALRDPRVLAAPDVALAVFQAVLPEGASDDVAILAAQRQR